MKTEASKGYVISLSVKDYDEFYEQTNKVSKMDVYIWLEDKDINCNESIFNSMLKYLKIFAATFIITLTVKAFVPSTKEALMIFGVGSTIEYLKSNEKAMQLPDKCIDALDAWVEELNKKERKRDE